MKRAILLFFALVTFGSGCLYAGEFTKTPVDLTELDSKVREFVEGIQGGKLEPERFSAEKYVIKFGSKSWVNIKTQGFGSRGESQLPDRAANVVLYLIQQKGAPSPRRIFYWLGGGSSTHGSYLYFNSTVPAKVETTMIGPRFSLTAHNENSKDETLYQIIVEQTPVAR
jgi:hypothetical protein